MSFSFLGTTDTALRLGVSAERVRQLEREGRLAAEKTPKGRRIFRVEDVEQLAVEREQQRRERAARVA
ncbi:MAG: hypothetical protein V7641_489 [Blastocatellia bacterium]